jgi:hypothetical protein
MNGGYDDVEVILNVASCFYETIAAMEHEVDLKNSTNKKVTKAYTKKIINALTIVLNEFEERPLKNFQFNRYQYKFVKCFFITPTSKSYMIKSA